jgi:glycosyltransferase involved in cell wall biosynthesis
VIHTVHFPLAEPRRSFLRRFADDVYLTAISNYQRQECPELPWSGMVYNAVDVDSFEVQEDKEDYLLCVGRVCERKGQDLAIEIARRAGLRLVLAGRVHPKEMGFFAEHVVPRLDGERVQYFGEVTAERKRELLAGARALLFPVREPEPFGLVLVEALASGTPVVGEPLGAVPEVVRDGETGLLASGIDALVDAVARVGRISPLRCREDAVARFHPRAMADAYGALYRDVLASL